DVAVIPGGSSYSVGSDGRGCLTLQTGAGTVKFRFGLSNGFKSGSPKSGRIIEFDDTTGTGTRGSGFIRVQDTSAFMNSSIANSYAFGLSGFSTLGHFSSAGTLTSGIPSGTITKGNFDSDNAGTVTTNDSTLTGVFNIPAMSKDGRGSLSITYGATTFKYAMYVVNAFDFIMVGIDNVTAVLPINSGEAISSIGPFNSGSVTGSHLIRATALSGQGPHATIGVLTFHGTKGVPGTLFDDKGGTTSSTTITPGLVTYAVDSTTGRLTFTGLGANSPVAYIVPNLN